MRKLIVVSLIAALMAACSATVEQPKTGGKGGGLASTGRPAWGSTIAAP